jgi:hypothetical protein
MIYVLSLFSKETAMAPITHKFVVFIAFGYLISSCTKSSNGGGTGGTIPVPDSTVYIAGNTGAYPVLWKNGVADTLSPTFGDANQIVLSGTDVYVAGYYQNTINPHTNSVNSGTDIGQYVYWVNGKSNNIDTLQLIGYPPTVAVSGTDVYFSNGYGWKNGTLISFPATGSSAKNFFFGKVISSFADGTDIYFAGTDTLQNVVYWKNGVLTIAAPYGGRGTTLPLADCMYVSGGNVYVGGMADRGVYWLNGTAYFMQPQPNHNSYLSNVNSLFVSGMDVYNTGAMIPIGLPAGVYLGASYWKNGMENDLSLISPANANTSYVTSSVFVSGTDIYVSGYSRTFISPSSPSIDSAVYWKNGVEYSLHTPGRANSIFVK